MINSAHHAADIGCDHGRLSVALLQQGRAKQVTASDISEPSLEKARLLAQKCSLSDKMHTVVSDGISHLSIGCADAIIIAGMGGELIARILSAAPDVAHSTDAIVMQPMRGVEELRRFLRENSFRIVDERLVLDAGRIYQIISAAPGEPGAIPPWFPQDEYSLGYMMFERGDPLLLPLLEQYKAGHMRRLAQAERKGVSPEALLGIIKRADSLINLATEMKK
ncbi:MAG: SAM-dependent methyltransferase [Clostridia bacterium]|nr:SAM-dependent methyltransferase [Clostridia bacterium]